MPKQKIIQWTLRMPEDLMKWLRIAAAKETIRREKTGSMRSPPRNHCVHDIEERKEKGGE